MRNKLYYKDAKREKKIITKENFMPEGKTVKT